MIVRVSNRVELETILSQSYARHKLPDKRMHLLIQSPLGFGIGQAVIDFVRSQDIPHQMFGLITEAGLRGTIHNGTRIKGLLETHSDKIIIIQDSHFNWKQYYTFLETGKVSVALSTGKIEFKSNATIWHIKQPLMLTKEEERIFTVVREVRKCDDL